MNTIPDNQDIEKRLKTMLDELLQVSDTAKESARTVELDQARVGRLSRMDALQAQAMSIESNRRREQQIKRIKSALERLETGEYGLCLVCGEEINRSRLDVDPAAPLCIECANRIDRG